MKNKIKSIIFLLLSFGVFLAVCSYVLYREPDVEKILEQSELKNKTFSAQIQKIRTPAGINVYFLRDVSVPIISLSFMFLKSGIAYEKEDAGAPVFLGEFLGSAIENMAPEKLREFLLQNGINIDFRASYDDFSGQVALPKANLASSMNIISQIFNSPSFNEGEMNIVKARLIFAKTAQSENEKEIFDEFSRRSLYKNHPYSRDKIASIEKIKSISEKDLRSYMQNYFSKENLVVGICGDIDEKEAVELTDALFSKLPEHLKTEDIKVAKPDFSKKKYVFERKDFSQNKVMIAAAGVARNSPDFYPLFVANEIFGGRGLSTRLNTELRGKRGLTYGAYSWLQISDKAPFLKAFFETSPNNFAKSVKIAKKEWEKMGTDGVTKDEFDHTINYLLDSYNLRFASTMGISSMLAEIQKYNLGDDFLRRRNDYIKKIKLEEVNTAAKKYFDDNFIFISVGDIGYE